MQTFIRFVSENQLKCDFISLHAKGSWSSSEPPNFADAINAVIQTADLAIDINATRFAGIEIINNEADMRVGFNIPFEPRMDERFSAWLSALMIAYDGLSTRYVQHRMRFHAASDNANQQLVLNSFDGRRSIMTMASSSPRDLLKVAAFNAYQVLPLLGAAHGSTIEGTETLFPNSELLHLVSVSDTHVGSVFVIHPRTATDQRRVHAIEYRLMDIPWKRVNVATFLIDASHSNPYPASLGRTSRFSSLIWPANCAAYRNSPSPLRSPVTSYCRTVNLVRALRFVLTEYWPTGLRHFDSIGQLTRFGEARAEDGNIILRWRPEFREPYFYSYEVFLVTGDSPVLLSPTPLRSAIWIDTAPPPGPRIYAVRAVTASGINSELCADASGLQLNRPRGLGYTRGLRCRRFRTFNPDCIPSRWQPS